MARAKFRQVDVTRAIRAAKASGLDVARVEIDAEGKITIVTGSAEPVLPTAESALERFEKERGAIEEERALRLRQWLAVARKCGFSGAWWERTSGWANLKAATSGVSVDCHWENAQMGAFGGGPSGEKGSMRQCGDRPVKAARWPGETLAAGGAAI
jgi:hypothetical protein